MDNSGGRLFLMAIVGWLLIEVGLTGRLGSMLASFIDPQAMIEQNQSGSAATGLVNVSGLPQSGTLTPKQIGLYAINAGFGAGNNALVLAIAIALAESGGNINAHNPGSRTDIENSYGLWQINILAHPSYSAARLLTPAYNAQAAYDISSGGSNWNPWGTYTSGAYRAHMSAAQQGAIEAAAANIGLG
jgi:Lysozyme like domain